MTSDETIRGHRNTPFHHRTSRSIDDYQARARMAAGYGLPYERDKVQAEPLVAGIVAMTCEHCGCTSAKVRDAKRSPCDFCGKLPRPVHGLSCWQTPTERVLNDRKACSD